MQIRINKFLSDAGFCSRREADKLVEEGRVSVNGRKLMLGDKIKESDSVFVDGKFVQAEKEEIILAFNKPVGIVCTTTDKQGDNNIVDYIAYPKRIYPVGRLDKDSQGLILMTNNGELMNRMLNAAYSHEKEYLVDLDKEITDDFIESMSKGVYLEELAKKTSPCKVYPIYKDGDKKNPTKRFKIILTQGLNRQVRRMCQAFGYRVRRLKRVRIMNIQLGNLAIGQYRNLTNAEYNKLMKSLGLKTK